MFSLVKSIIGFGQVKTSSQDHIIEEAFSETQDDASDQDTELVDNAFEDEFKDIVATGKVDEDKWDDDWMAFDEEITKDMKSLLSFDAKNCSANGVVTQIVNQNQIVINNEKNIRFDVSIALSVS